MKKITLLLIAFAIFGISLANINTAEAYTTCQSGWAFNPFTGESCFSAPTLPPGCSSGYIFSPLTGVSCKPYPMPTPPRQVNRITIDRVSGPQKLEINQKGTWKIKAHDEQGGNLSYSVSWGDEGYRDTSGTLTAYMPEQQSATFTHKYAQGGTYYPTFKVSNDYGSESTSLSVKVGENFCPRGGYNPVTGAYCPTGTGDLSITTSSLLPYAKAGQAYFVALNVSGGDASSYKWSVNNGAAAFPVTGLGLSSTYGKQIYIIGTPAKVYIGGVEQTTTYPFIFNITVTSGSKSFTKQFVLNVDPATTSSYEDYRPGTVGGYGGW